MDDATDCKASVVTAEISSSGARYKARDSNACACLTTTPRLPGNQEGVDDQMSGLVGVLEGVVQGILIP